MKIKELAKMTGVDVATLQYIAQKGTHPMLAARPTGTRLRYIINEIELKRYLAGESSFNVAEELKKIGG